MWIFPSAVLFISANHRHDTRSKDCLTPGCWRKESVCVSVCVGSVESSALREGRPPGTRDEYWRSKLLGSLIIHLGASCFPSLWTAGQLNCLWINSLACYWLLGVSEVHLNPRNPITLGRGGKHSTGGLSECWCWAHYSPSLFIYLQSFRWVVLRFEFPHLLFSISIKRSVVAFPYLFLKVVCVVFVNHSLAAVISGTVPITDRSSLFGIDSEP